MGLRAGLEAKIGVKAKLPWPNLDADGGEEYEEGGKREDESDPHLFSMSQYEHTSATDDADVAEDEPFQDDSMNHGDDSELRDNDDDDDDDDPVESQDNPASLATKYGLRER